MSFPLVFHPTFRRLGFAHGRQVRAVSGWGACRRPGLPTRGTTARYLSAYTTVTGARVGYSGGRYDRRARSASTPYARPY